MQLYLQVEPEIHLRSRTAATNAPVVQRRFLKDDEDIFRLNTKGAEAPDDGDVEICLGFQRATGEEQNLYESVIVTLARWNRKVLGFVLHVSNLAIVFGNMERLAQGEVNRFNERLNFSGRPRATYFYLGKWHGIISDGVEELGDTLCFMAYSNGEYLVMEAAD
jgi:hypothetical protein